MSFPQVKEALQESTRPLVEPVPELNGTKRPTILDVPAFQEVPELGIKGTNIHPPQLVEDLDLDLEGGIGSTKTSVFNTDSCRTN